MTENNEQQREAPQISLQDIAFVVQLIDVCTKRGAFEGNELTSVGTVREKFDTFVKMNAPTEEQPQENTEEQAAE